MLNQSNRSPKQAELAVARKTDGIDRTRKVGKIEYIMHLRGVAQHG